MPIIDYFWDPYWNFEGRSQDNGFLEDEFGFKKIIFGLTNDHKTVSAISTKAGYVEWNLNFEKALEEEKFIDDKTHLVFSKIFVFEKEETEDDLLILWENSKGNTVLFICSPNSGAIRRKVHYENVKIRDAFKLHLSPMHEVLIIIDQNQKAHSYPEVLTQDL